MRYFLPLYFIAYVTLVFFWRSYQVRRMTGVNPVVIKKSDDAHDFIVRVFKLVFSVVVLVIVVNSFLPRFYRFTGPISWLEHSTGAVDGHRIVTLIVDLDLHRSISDGPIMANWN